MSKVLTQVQIDSKIYTIRDKKVMLDYDLAALYGVETKQLKRAVLRNKERFPADFMFKLNANECEILRCQIGTSSWGGRRYLPYAFTQEGVAMLSGVLNSARAVQMNIEIMRVFIRFREYLADHKQIAAKFEELEGRLGKHDDEIESIMQAIQTLLDGPVKRIKKIGFNRM